MHSGEKILSSELPLIIKEIHVIYLFFRYQDKKDVVDVPYNEAKRTFVEKRGMTCVLQNKRPNKLRDRLKDLEVLVQFLIVDCSILNIQF